MLSSFSA